MIETLGLLGLTVLSGLALGLGFVLIGLSIERRVIRIAALLSLAVMLIWLVTGCMLTRTWG